MGKANTLLEWANKQEDWVRDALRRHAASPQFVLGDADRNAVLNSVRHAAGIQQENELNHIPISAEHLKLNLSDGVRSLLCSLGPVENLGRLAPEQTLSFALNGITVIYGDNGSGKSCYCRITKHICRSLTTEDLLGNVFDSGTKPAVKVRIRYLTDGTDDIGEEYWTYGTRSPEAVGNISVFDSRNARFYVDKQSRIGFVPAEIALLEEHGKFRGELEAIFKSERKTLEKRLNVQLPTGFTSNGKAATTIARLEINSRELPSIDELEVLGSWSDDDHLATQELETTLAQDSAALADRYRRTASTLDRYVQVLNIVETRLNNHTTENLASAALTAIATARAAALSAGEVFADEPLADVGKEPWRLMYDYAKAYIAAIGDGEELPSAEGALCALCQQPLSREASNRLDRFRNFLAGAANKYARIAEKALEEAIYDVKAISIPVADSVRRELAEYCSINADRAALGVKVIAYLEAAAIRKRRLEEAAMDGNFSNILPPPEALSAIVEVEVKALYREAQSHSDHGQRDKERTQQLARLNELKDKEKFHSALATILARRADLECLSEIRRCINLVGTQQLSQVLTKIRREIVTDGLERRVQAELEFLHLDYMPFIVIDRSRDGHSYFEVSLDAAVKAANERVLSEGEQRALALACYLAETGADTANHGLIIDDPVSSLDHLRIRLVAERLVAEAAKGKQVIIFTHNLVFYNEVIYAASAAIPPVPIARRSITKSESEGFGLIFEEDEPWIAQRVKPRISRLKEFLKKFDEIQDYNTNEYRIFVKEFYSDLRETWERLVEELLLNKVVERYCSDVKTQSLKGVLVADEDYRTVYWAMKRVSELSGHDMAAGRHIPVPRPAEMKADLDKIESYESEIRKRAKKLEVDRKELEKPQLARVAV